MNDEKLQIDIWSDVACPWCYVGKRRFEAALAAFEHRDQVEVTWHSFELDPTAAPARETDSATHLAAKYGMTREQAQAKLRQMTDLAAGDGLAFDFERARGANMFDAHRLVHLAAAHGRQDAMKERLFRAYLGEGELVSDHATLARLADDVGLPAAEVRDVLATDRYAAEVREDEGTASALGITAVPFFVADRKMGVAGAQSPEVLGELLRRAWESRSPLAAVADGAACGPDGC